MILLAKLHHHVHFFFCAMGINFQVQFQARSGTSHHTSHCRRLNTFSSPQAYHVQSILQKPPESAQTIWRILRLERRKGRASQSFYWERRQLAFCRACRIKWKPSIDIVGNWLHTQTLHLDEVHWQKLRIQCDQWWVSQDEARRGHAIKHSSLEGEQTAHTKDGPVWIIIGCSFIIRMLTRQSYWGRRVTVFSNSQKNWHIKCAL